MKDNDKEGNASLTQIYNWTARPVVKLISDRQVTEICKKVAYQLNGLTNM